jgi:hypothetical protein
MELITKNETALGDVTRGKTPGDPGGKWRGVEALARSPRVVRCGDVAAGTDAAFPVYASTGRAKVHDARIVVDADVAADATNYAVVSLLNKGGDGTGTEVLAGVSTKTPGGVSLVDFVAQSLGDLGEGAAAMVVLQDREGTPADTLRVEALRKGRAGNALSVTIADGTKNPATEFRLVVKKDGTVVETFDDLSMDPEAGNYVGKIASAWVQAVDLGSESDPPNNRPKVQADVALTGGANGAYLEDGDVLALVVDESHGTGAALTGLTLSLSIGPIVEGALS